MMSWEEARAYLYTEIYHILARCSYYTERSGGDGDHDILLCGQRSALLQLASGFRHSPENALLADKIRERWAPTTVGGPEIDQDTTRDQSMREHTTWSCLHHLYGNCYIYIAGSRDTR